MPCSLPGSSCLTICRSQHLKHGHDCAVLSSGSFGSRNDSEDDCATLGLDSFLGVGTEGMISLESESDELLLSSESDSMIALLATLLAGTSLLLVSLLVSLLLDSSAS